MESWVDPCCAFSSCVTRSQLLDPAKQRFDGFLIDIELAVDLLALKYGGARENCQQHRKKPPPKHPEGEGSGGLVVPRNTKSHRKLLKSGGPRSRATPVKT